MSILTPKRILNLSQQSDRRAQTIEFGEIDHGLPFFPEPFTQLYHTPLYGDLTRRQRLTYNQLCGVSANEHFMQFESGFTHRVIAKLARHPLVARERELQQCLLIMLQEEMRHCAMFRDLNRHCMPGLYQKSDYFFIQMSLLERVLLGCFTQIPQHLFFLIWLVLIIEEYSNHISRWMLAKPGTQTLGPLESNFVKTHRAHLLDESRHVHIDARLLDLFIGRAGRLKRGANALALKTVLREIITPKRAALAVVRMLVRQHPELKARARALRAAVRGLKVDPGFALTLTQAAQSPLTRLLQEHFPEFLIPLAEWGLDVNE